MDLMSHNLMVAIIYRQIFQPIEAIGTGTGSSGRLQPIDELLQWRRTTSGGTRRPKDAEERRVGRCGKFMSVLVHGQHTRRALVNAFVNKAIRWFNPFSGEGVLKKRYSKTFIQRVIDGGVNCSGKEGNTFNKDV